MTSGLSVGCKNFLLCRGYFLVAVMIFLAAQDPYLANVLKVDTKISNMQVNDVVDYEINSTKISGVYEADELNRYSDRDEFLDFKAKILRGNLRHFLSSDKAISQNDEIIFQKMRTMKTTIV